ncbi:hypothetical protein Acr_04g0006000 [Actinidia rufa]|uniref:Uncharacterized protein n=1 Tax=Actinidia rufa TaxID=165716 RepID=A0A7J0EHV8_9ERIC|nr:hypothetical protein Acr_04g0006000 [Actinidia rufa]
MRVRGYSLVRVAARETSLGAWLILISLADIQVACEGASETRFPMQFGAGAPYRREEQPSIAGLNKASTLTADVCSSTRVARSTMSSSFAFFNSPSRELAFLWSCQQWLLIDQALQQNDLKPKAQGYNGSGWGGTCRVGSYLISSFAEGVGAGARAMRFVWTGSSRLSNFINFGGIFTYEFEFAPFPPRKECSTSTQRAWGIWGTLGNMGASSSELTTRTRSTAANHGKGSNKLTSYKLK